MSIESLTATLFGRQASKAKKQEYGETGHGPK